MKLIDAKGEIITQGRQVELKIWQHWLEKDLLASSGFTSLFQNSEYLIADHSYFRKITCLKIKGEKSVRY